ncbi:hypothetical protein [Listeria seeligeri]|uniref:hypothetical protein n=1 Tax=Listeria seeligeri TaxID=1640 RepID=UPI001629E1CB|nr:hypothetical protein [Listeria seeligeri]MBC1533471.1 hypothetical protein [Listeria seeligeri]MBC1740487.1 hypothetical protein [Listeria seeligeri]MBC1746083.1 hypothetical protein [Listeria seeligeri]MBC1748939.1 hypothetical protein [Listeria seeligeri]MBC1821774.1 hypothetical protein [Listeria seeligeri]
MEFKHAVQNSFADIIQEYQFDLIKVNEDEIMLLNPNYALTIWKSREGIDIYYLFLNQLEKVKITNFLFPSYEKSLLTNIVLANNLADKISKGLLIHSRGLRKYFLELLAGKTDWIEEFKNNHFYNEAREINNDELAAYQIGI